MTNNNEPVSIGILAYPKVQLSAVHGLVDLFQMANMLAREEDPKAPRLRVDHFEKPEERKDRKYTAILLPPSLEERLSGDEMAGMTGWIRQCHEDGTMICSVCAGAFPVAESGLLDGRPATTHWTFAEEFSNRYPNVKLDTDKLIIDDGDIVTAGGLMAWIDLGLKLIAKFMSPAIMLATARFFLVDPSGREQRFYSCFSPPLHHGDKAILRTQHWLQIRFGNALTVPMMAEIAGLEGRTFIRRFHRATGLNPSEYLQQLRIAKARELIELSDLNIEEVAWQVGYEDTGSFRRIFQKITGLTPKEHRTRFAAFRFT